MIRTLRPKFISDTPLIRPSYPHSTFRTMTPVKMPLGLILTVYSKMLTLFRNYNAMLPNTHTNIPLGPVLM